jgi:predicted acyl esterase
MTVDFDVPIEMDDGIVLRADVFRPVEDGEYPVIMALGPYGKGVDFEQGYPTVWALMVEESPEIVENTSNAYQNFEHVDPEKWVPDGYVCVRVDGRGSGRSPGVLDIFSPRETRDYHDCIEWAAAQTWSNGKIGLHGISYYAMNQWQVAALQPPHLAAMCVWEGAGEWYREVYRHGGIGNDFILRRWYDVQVLSAQHGRGERGRRSSVTGELIAGPETLTEAELATNRTSPPTDVLAHPLDDEYYRRMLPAYDKITVPFLSSGNWGGHGLHTRGNVEGYLAASAPDKWLEMHGNSHCGPFYTDAGIALQKRFFGHFLKGEDTGWAGQPPVQLDIRHPGERFVTRTENEWPIARTRWTKLYLDPADRALRHSPVTGEPVSYETTGDGLLFLTPPMEEDTEITGPVAARLVVSSQTVDADVFLSLQLFDPAGEEVTFVGSVDTMVPIALGWLRASHRKLDPARSLPYRPYHAHDELLALEPGEPVELDVEIWPTCIVVPRGYRLGLGVRGKDYENTTHYAPHQPEPMNGTWPFGHHDVTDRPPAIFDTVNTLHFDMGREPHLLLPVIPPLPVDDFVT